MASVEEQAERSGDGGSPGQVTTPASVTVPMEMGKCSGNKIDFKSNRSLVQIPASALSSCVIFDRSLHFLSAFFFFFPIVEIIPLFQGCFEPKVREWALSLTRGHLITPQDGFGP